jgi:putative PIN family toxin of toxin-antitoxin system
MLWVSYSTLPNGYQHRLIERALRQRVRLFTSEYILDELSATLINGLGLSTRFAQRSIDAVRRIARVVKLPAIIPRYVPDDPADDPVVQTAITAKADYLVTFDKAILEVGKIRSVQFVTPQEFEFLLARHE